MLLCMLILMLFVVVFLLLTLLLLVGVVVFVVVVLQAVDLKGYILAQLSSFAYFYLGLLFINVGKAS